MGEGYVRQCYRAAGTADVGGIEIPYVSTVENFPIRGKSGEIDASMFTFSYEKSGEEDQVGRPVLFAWNGGPGCGSVFVHLGLLAPEIVDTGTGPDMRMSAPFRLVRNDHCLLDTCDVVAVDAIDTGYSRMLNPERRSDFFCTEGDAIAFVQCIRAWLSAHNRWNSPIYLMGESYGTIRNALVADYMFYHNIGFSGGSPLQVSGIIMVGTALNYGQPDFPVPESVLVLPALAAANWYWSGGEPGKDRGSLKEFVDECEAFCLGEYVQALAKGRSLPQKEREEIADQVSRYSGYSRETVLKQNLQVKVWDFAASPETTCGRTVGLYDARFGFAPIPYADKRDVFGDDPSNQQICPAFTALYHNVWKKALNVECEEEYIEFAGESDSWDLKTKISPIESLEKAMYRNPGLRLMFGVGYYDLTCTLGWVRYLVNHYELPADRTVVKCYEAGHMTYIGREQVRQFEDDIKAFIKNGEKNETV